MQLRATRLSAISNAVRAGFRGALDGLSAATKAALVHLSSGNRLLKTYPDTAPELRVRRSTDNAESDIGALKNGWIDAASAVSFAGSGDLFAVTGYDQRVTSIEERRNLLTWTEDIDTQANWQKTNCTVTRTSLTVGGQSATAFQILSSGGFARIRQSVTSNNGTASFLAAAGTTNFVAIETVTSGSSPAVFDLITGTVVSGVGTITAVSAGVWRCSVSVIGSAGSVAVQIAPSNGSGRDSAAGDTITVLRPQFELTALTDYQRVDAGTEFPKRFVGAVVDSHELTQSTATAQPRLTVWPQEEAPVYEWSAANGTDGWVGASGATVTVVDGKLRVTDVPSGAAGRAVKTIPTVVGKAYRVFVNPTAGSAALGLVRASVNEAYGTNIGGLDGTNDFVFTATTTSTNILLITGADDGRWCEWDTIRVTPAYTEGNRIALSSMTAMGTCVVNDVAGAITFAQSDDVFSGAVMLLSNVMDEGALYEISIDCTAYTNGRFQLYTEQATAGTGINVYTSTINATGTYRFYVRMSSAQQRITIARQGGVSTVHNATFGNFVCRKIAGSRRNLLTHSAQIGNAVWTKAGASVTAGSNVLVENSGANTQHRLTRSVTMVTDLSTPAGANKTFGIQAKVKRIVGSRHFQIGLTFNNNTTRIYYNLDTGVVAAVSGSIAPSGTIELLPTGEWLCKATVTGASASSANMFLAMTNTPTINAETYTGDGMSSLQITDIQYELGVPSAYQMVGANAAAGVLCYEPSKKHVASWNFDGASDYFERPATDFPADLHTLTGVTVALRIDPLTNAVGAIWAMRDNSNGFISIARNANGTISIEHRNDANVYRQQNSVATVGVGSSAVIIARWNFVTGTATLRINGVQQPTLTGLGIAPATLTARRHLIGASRPSTSVTAYFAGFISEPIIINAHASDAECVIIENALKEGLK